MTVNAYPGNPSLPDEVKERVLTTFDQTLTLFDEAQLDEVIAGCDLILDMDERFEPAKKLRQKAKDPAAQIDMAPLYELRDSRGSAEPPAEGDDAETEILQAVEELNNGNYEQAVEICNRILASNPDHEEAQKIGQQANERLEAGPFIKQFLQEANEAIDAGNPDAARGLIEKAKSLDPLHPEISDAESRLESAPAAAPSQEGGGGGSGFDFGGDASPFAAAFGGETTGDTASGEKEEETAEEPEATGFVPPAGEEAPASFDFAAAAEEEETPASAPTPEEEEPTDFAAPAEEEPPAADFTAPAEEEPPATDFAASAEEEPEATDFAAPAAEEPAPEAAEFGFTLEEEPSEGAPGSAAQPEPEQPETIAGEAQTFDFSGGDVEITDDDQSKIESYLGEGDRLFEAGDYQGAIDAWSKIFLIDVTNEQASERIEAAKEKKRGADEKLDELLNTGIAAYDREDYTTAKQTFEEVLAQDPDNFRAQEYLEKLADHAAATGAAEPPPASPAEPEAAEAAEPAGDVYEGEMPEEDLYQPPPPAAAPAEKPKPKPSPKPTSGRSPKTMIIAAVAIIVLAVGGWLAWSMIGGDDAATVDASVTQGKINRAEVLAENGDYAQAISILSSIEAGDPMRDQALQLIAQYKQQQAQAGGTVGGRPASQVQDELLAEARDAFAAEDYLSARTNFEEAAKIKPLDQADREMYEAASRQVSKLDTASALFAQGSYSEAIDELDKVLQEEPDNVNAREMLINAHYNLGVLALRNRNLDEAIEEFRFVLEQNPNDSMALRSMEIAQQYQGSTKDLMYEIYVKYLPLR